MRKSYVLISAVLWVACSSAQTSSADAPSLSQVRAAYDAPFSRNLQSFTCAVKFSWKEHFRETPRVGDEGTDEQIAKLIQPIQNHVTVTQQDAILASGMSDEEESKLPYKGMAEGLLKHAVRFSLRTWLNASNNRMLPSAGTPVQIDTKNAGYAIKFKIQRFDVSMLLKKDMSLQNMSVIGSEADRQEFEFSPGPQGLVVSSWTMGENGNFVRGNRIIFSYSYQTVDGFQLPAHMVVNRESHHEVWQYDLTGCSVTKKP